MARSGDGDDRLSSLSEQEVADQRTSLEVNNGGSEEQKEKKVWRRKKRYVSGLQTKLCSLNCNQSPHHRALKAFEDFEIVLKCCPLFVSFVLCVKLSNQTKKFYVEAGIPLSQTLNSSR